MHTIKNEHSELLPDTDLLEKLKRGTLSDPHSILGMHNTSDSGDIAVRVYDTEADSVLLTDLVDGNHYELKKADDSGLFSIVFAGCKEHFAYKLLRKYGDTEFESEDPYTFLPGIGEMDRYLFNEGEHQKVYEFMGAHHRMMGEVSGISFTVWAPNAERVSVVGDFNCWDGRRNPMRIMGSSGIWELFIPRLEAGNIYKYEIRSANGDIFLKQDPYSRCTQMRPETGSVIAQKEEFDWNDDKWLKARSEAKLWEKPVNIYEVHLASWCGPGLRELDENNEDDFHNYRDIADSLAEYVKKMGYTHIELMPVEEHPLDISWGYQVTGYYAPTARHGSPEDFAYFVDYMHKNDIGVILDWVPAHFPKDSFSLARFDGTALYEHSDPRQGEQQDWGTYIFNFGRNEVRNFLIGNALYWIDKFHIDGLRVDAVASMIYLDYSKEDGDWIPNKYGGNENLEAISLLKRLNILSNELFPGTVMIAEESTAWPGVTHQAHLGGLGFTFKWNMGWMHDTLEYFQYDPVHRSHHQGELTFSLIYAHSENFILPFSHDEVVHGKKSLLDKMPGDQWQKFANLRSLYAYMLTHPGKKLLFMGSEFGQWIEWNCQKGLDWLLLDYPQHRALQTMSIELNHLYRKHSALWENDISPDGFQWIDASNYRESVISYIRWDKKRKNPILYMANLTPVVRENYQFGVPSAGKWEEILNTDSERFGGSGIVNYDIPETVHSKELFHGQHEKISLDLPPLGSVILKHK